MKKMIWLISGVWVATMLSPPLDVSSPPLSWLVEETRKRASSPYLQMLDLLQDSVVGYQVFEGKAPAHLQELCASAYMPVDCKDILVPVQNRPILETEEGKPGSFSIAPDLERPPAVIITYFYPSGKKDTYEVPDQKTRAELIPQLLDPEDVKGWTAEIKTAVQVVRFLRRKLNEYHEYNGYRNPVSLLDVYQVYPILSKLRNPFTGKYAEPRVVDCKLGSLTTQDIPKDTPDGTPVLCPWKIDDFFGTPSPEAYVKGKLYRLRVRCKILDQMQEGYGLKPLAPISEKCGY